MNKKYNRITALCCALTIMASLSACEMNDFPLFSSGNADSTTSSGSVSVIESSGTYESSLSDSSSTSDSSSASDSSSTEASYESLSIHFLEFGNRTSGDCILIDVGDTEVLIDAGSTTGAAKTIVPYIQQYCEDGVLEYVIATHYDSDHISAFVGSDGSGVFDNFFCQTIIDSALTTKKSQTYKDYVALRDKEVEEGAKHYTSLECWNNENGAQRSYTLGDGVTLNILYQKYYETKTSTENNYSVCVLLSQGDNHFLFTGDLEQGGEASLLEHNDLPKCKLYKAGHHGSNTASSPALLSKIEPEIVVFCCCCGDRYAFPHQETIDTVAKYTDKVYVLAVATGTSGFASMNGNIVVTATIESVTVNCSNNNTLFKDTDWFQENREVPDEWWQG